MSPADESPNGAIDTTSRIDDRVGERVERDRHVRPLLIWPTAVSSRSVVSNCQPAGSATRTTIVPGATVSPTRASTDATTPGDRRRHRQVVTSRVAAVRPAVARATSAVAASAAASAASRA